MHVDRSVEERKILSFLAHFAPSDGRPDAPQTAWC